MDLEPAEIGPAALNGHYPEGANTLDRLIGFSVPGRSARGRIGRLGPTLNTILAAHAYPPPVARLLGEALTLTALLGSMLRADEGQMTLQAQSHGAVVDLLVCDWRAGGLRGYLRHDPVKLARLGKRPSLHALMGTGYLAITLDQTSSTESYQGIVPLEGGSLAEIAEHYFAQSEQLPTLVRLAVDEVDGHWSAGGLILQHLPRGEVGGPRLFAADDHPDWAHVRALGSTASAAELVDPALPLETLLWRLMNEDEVRTFPAVSVARGCRCSPEHIESVLARFSADDLAHMREADGTVSVDCAFCARTFAVNV